MESQRRHHARFSEVVDDVQSRRAHSTMDVISIEDHDDDRQSKYLSSNMTSHDQHASGESTSCSSKSYDSSKKYRGMCESFSNTIARLRRDLRFLRSENRRLQQLLDKQEASKSLECPVCLGEKEKWVFVQCGHLICDDCVLDLLKRQTLFNKHCPLCQAPITSLAVCYPNLR